MNCILCRTPDPKQIGGVSTHALKQVWKEKYDIVVDPYFTTEALTNYKCDSCRLDFYHPQSPGDDKLYEKLQVYDWYYEENKWEFRAAIDLLNEFGRGTALEIGCGTGNFLQRLRRAGFDKVTGVDSNEKALETARAASIEVYPDLAALGDRRFDYVFAFQVLEHVPDPRAFMETLTGLLAPGGRLLIAVPNQEGFVGENANNELNQPPHHCSRFGEFTLRAAAGFLPVRCERILVEPLAPHHIDWFVSTKMLRLQAASRQLSRLAWKTIAPLASLALKQERVRRLFKGHTILAVYRLN